MSFFKGPNADPFTGSKTNTREHGQVF